MIQRFIELGEGYSDVYELCELARQMPDRVAHYLSLSTVKNEKNVTSLAILLNPAAQGGFQPVYICLEGVPDPNYTNNKRYTLFAETAKEHGHHVKELIVRPSTQFHESNLFYQYLIGIFQMNRLIKNN
ncbi:DUF7147 family protein [Sediminibacillus albus]|uniref:DUF7147 domain-containing protein n=1 Tax=Sediminibacillus albus TaxID=407036 RepID=A0A1G8W8M5_9BACI|nr:methylthioribose kinase [Sediminibacillus albus]SDJ74654.1 hypothetical protein SAMN05216243_0629 [Sediminibacillus albus]